MPGEIWRFAAASPFKQGSFTVEICKPKRTYFSNQPKCGSLQEHGNKIVGFSTGLGIQVKGSEGCTFSSRRFRCANVLANVYCAIRVALHFFSSATMWRSWGYICGRKLDRLTCLILGLLRSDGRFFLTWVFCTNGATFFFPYQLANKLIRGHLGIGPTYSMLRPKVLRLL